jgi:hypothetical protein
MNSSKPWLANYPKDIPETINSDTYTSINAMFDEVFANFAGRHVIEYMGKR